MRITQMLVMLSTVCLVVLPRAAEAGQAKPKTLRLEALPASVQRTVRDTLHGGTIKTITQETEGGVRQDEVESLLDGRTRDFNVDASGRLLVVEEATTLDAIPAAARVAIQKRVGTGTLGTVETFLETGQAMAYEASYKDHAGKTHEILVKADGTERKE